MESPFTSFVTRLNHEAIIDLVMNAQERIYYTAPNISEVRAEILKKAAEKGCEVKVVLDTKEENYRNGYGDFTALEILRGAGVEIYDAPNNLISFILSDGEGFLLFPLSRILGEEDAGTNAVRINATTAAHLIAYFFPPQTETEKEDTIRYLYETVPHQTQRDLDEAVERLGNPRSPLPPPNEKQLAATRQSLEQNPPLNPDLKRSMDVYTNKLQWVEIEFEGVNFFQIRIHIPPDALPIEDEDFRQRLEARLRLFDLNGQENGDTKNTNEDKYSWLAPLEELKAELKQIREEYLVHVRSRKKNIFKTEHRSELLRKLESIQKEIEQGKIELRNNLHAAILDAEDDLTNRLIALLRTNPPSRAKGLEGNLFERTIKRVAEEIMHQVKMPEPDKLLDKLSLQWNFYDLTWDDFKNVDFINELKKAKIIEKATADELRKMQTAFATREHSTTVVKKP